MGVKGYLIQLYGFVVKVSLQRWRSPVTTLVELLLPFLFSLLLSICYWTTDRTTEPATVFDGNLAAAYNYSSFLPVFFCQPETATYSYSLPPCPPPPMRTCLTKIGSGGEVCYPVYMGTSISGSAMGLYFVTGVTITFNLDGYLVWSAFMTEQYDTTLPTFLGRSSRASISHYGELLVASDDAAVADGFMSYMEGQSNLSRFVIHQDAFADYDAALSYAMDHPENIWAIVDLPSSMMHATGAEPGEFTIGMNFTATPWTFRQNTRSLFSRPQAGTGGYAMYYASGFVTLQSLVNNYYIDQRLAGGAVESGPATFADIGSPNSMRSYLNNYGTFATPMPTPPTYNNSFLTQWQYYVPLIAVMAALFPVARLTALIVDEKPKGIRESMLIMGMHRTCMFGGWYLSSLLTDFIAALLVAMILKVGFLSYADYGILLVVYFTFLQQNTALGLCVSTLFSNPRLATWCAAFLVFIFAIPAYNFPDGMSAIAKILLSLLPCIGFTMSFFDLTEYASYGRNFTWDVAREGSFNVAIAIGMMWASWGIFMVLAFYLDRVWPGTVGLPEPWYFPVRPLLRCLRGRRAAAPVAMTQECPTLRRDLYTGLPIAAETAPPVSSAPYGSAPGSDCSSTGKPAAVAAEGGRCPMASKPRAAMVEHADDEVDPRDGSVAAVFDKVYKVYYGGGLVGWFYTFFTGLFRRGDRTVALDGVTFAMRKGEVSVLLGPNGAGKSTIMGAATGMVRATSGEVYIDGYAVSEDLDRCRQHIGYCPQVDIVWDELTVAEHLAFYSRLKGCSSFSVGAHVAKAVSLVGLEEKVDCKAENLSGGQRRRLCVAIALVADSTVLLLDEPTAGMDILGRKIVYDALNRARKNRSVLLCTHLLDEADRIGDRILVVNDGRLCAEGSAMFLKSQMQVGYVVTCVLQSGVAPVEEDRAVNRLIEFVKEKGYPDHAAEAPDAVVAVPAGCQLLGVERRGREVSFRFPMSLLSQGGEALLGALQESSAELGVRSVGLNLTSLEDVFMSATEGGPMMSAEAVEACVVADVEQRGGAYADAGEAEPDAYADSYESDSVLLTFVRHFRALFVKRCNFARRDLSLLVFQVFVPVMFLLLSLLINLIRSPEQPSLLLDMSMFPGPGEVLLGQAGNVADPFHIDASTPDAALGAGNVIDFIGSAPASANATSQFMSQLLAEQSDAHAMPRYYALATTGAYQTFYMRAGIPSAAVLHNISAAHALPIGLSALYNLARYQAFGDAVAPLQVRNRPMPIGEFQKELWDANKQVMIGIFVILPFVLIPCNTISYIVREKETGARHMQYLSGASIAAYWLSSFVFDFLCYIGTEFIAMIIFVIFDRKEYIKGDNLGATITVFLFFGFSSIASAYLLSFFFTSSFTAQTVVLLVNFVFGFLWVTLEEMLAMGAYEFTYYVTSIVRIFPAVSFAECLYVLAGRRIGTMMFPTNKQNSIYKLLTLERGGRFVGGVGTGLLYMGCVTAGSIVMLVILEYVRVQRLVALIANACGKGSRADRTARTDGDDAAAVLQGECDETVAAEEARVCGEDGGRLDDLIVTQHLTKQYFGSAAPSADDVSLGVRPGEVMGLLGLNGAGKSTVMGMIAGERAPSSGRAFVNHISVQRTRCRKFIGYCPQYNPLLDLLSVKEHLWLYARLRGMREVMIRGEVNMLVRELGLYPHRHQAACALSGGNKRRLSLAVALVGRTTSVLLDEPTAGMDTLARAQTCSVVRRLTGSKSVMLTTHLLDEVEALADRVTFMSRGRVACIGTPQELRGRANRDAAYTVNVTFSHDVDLTGEHAHVPRSVERYVREVIAEEEQAEQLEKEKEEAAQEGSAAGEAATEGGDGERWCVVTEVHVASMRVAVRAPLAEICRAMTGLQTGLAADVPAVDFVGVSQPTLEDILMCGEEEDEGAQQGV